MIHATYNRSRGFRYDKLGELHYIVRERDEGWFERTTEFLRDQAGLQRNLCPFERRVPRSSLPISSVFFFILSFSLHLYSPLQRLVKISPATIVVVVIVVVEISYTANKYSYIPNRESRRLYRVSRGMIFAPFNFDYESSRITRVSVRDGGLRAAAIAVGNLRHSPLVSSWCARAEVKDPRRCPILSIRFSFFTFLTVCTCIKFV